MKRESTRSWLAVLVALAMFMTACGSDEVTDTVTDAVSDAADAAGDAADAAVDAADDAVEAATDAADDAAEAVEDAMDDEEPADAGIALEGTVEIAAGTTLELDECPDDWDPYQGVDGDEIRLGESLPQSGALASFGAIGEGLQAYFDFINATDPIEGKDLVLVARDDGYEAGRAVANVEEMLDSDDIFSFVAMIGTPINVAVRPITHEACVPQLLNFSGFPFWGDPANFPWTVGNILNYVTETEIWCTSIIEDFGEGATVASLIMNNDFGKTYQKTMNESDSCAGIDIVSEQLHDPAAADVTNEMTTLLATDADILVAGTTSKFCSQTTAVLAASDWRPRTYMSYTCNNLSAFFTPVQEAVATLTADDAGPWMANSNKVCGDSKYLDDPAMIEVERVLNEYADVSCSDGPYSTGVLAGEFIVDILRSASELPGGLNRVNLMAATWNTDTTNDQLLGGTLKLDGINDAYWTEGAQLQAVVVDADGNLTFEPKGDFVDFEGQGGAYAG